VKFSLPVGQVDHRNQCVRFQSLIAAWFVVVLTVWILAAVVDQCVPPVRNAGISRTPVEVLSTWDGRWYADIALKGYSVEGKAIRRFAFFPLLPAIARLLGGQSHTVLAGILFGQLCLLGSLFLINRLAEVNDETPLRQQPGFWLLISPLSFFFSVFYTESLFLFLTLLTVNVCRTERFWLASLFGVMTGLTRPTAICLPVIFLWWAMRSLHERRRCLGLLLCAAAPFAGIALYVGTVSYILGDRIGYVQIQRQGWASEWSLPFAPMFRDLTNSFYNLTQAQIPPLGKIVRPYYPLASCFCSFGAGAIVMLRS
jgi:Gpi18-like mannosyltransferase